MMAAIAVWLATRESGAEPGQGVPLPTIEPPPALPRGTDAPPATLRALAPDAVPAERNDPAIVAAEGEMIEVRGFVVDREGHPIERASVLAQMRAGTSCVTGVDGAFRLPSAIRSGTNLVLRASCPRYLAANVAIIVRAASPTVIQLDRAPRISGTLVDARGESIEGYRLAAIGDIGQPLAAATTDAGGRFDLCRADPNREGYVVVSELFTHGHGLLAEKPRVAWGTEDLVLRAQSPGELEIRVTRSIDATPVAAFAVCLLHHEHQGPQGWDARRPVRVAAGDGVTRIRCIPGPVSAIVVPDDVDLQPGAMIAVVVPENGACVASVTLSPAPLQRVRVIDRQTGLGVPLADLHIVVGDSDDERRIDATLPRVAEAQGIRMLTWSRTGVLARAKTDANGVAVMRAADPGVEARVECVHADYRAVSLPLASGTPPPDLEVALDRGTLIRGVVGPPGILRFRPYLRTCHERSGKAVLGAWVPVDRETGSFEFAIDSTGEVRLDLALPSVGIGSATFGPVLTATGIARVAGGTPAARGEESVVVDAGANIPGTATGTVFVDGAIPAQVRLHRVVDGVANPGIAGETLVGPDGTFLIEPLLVGDWLVSAAVKPDGAGPDYLPVFFAACTVRAGDRLRFIGDVRTTTTAMIVCDAAGSPLAEGQAVTLALKRCPQRRVAAKLGPGGVLSVPGVVSTEIVHVRVEGGRLAKQAGEEHAGAARVVVR